VTNVDSGSSRSFYRDLLQYATQIELVDISFALEGDPLISNYNIPGVCGEARDAGFDLEVRKILLW
jgi:hypothetical protein